MPRRGRQALAAVAVAFSSADKSLVRTNSATETDPRTSPILSFTSSGGSLRLYSCSPLR